VIPRATLEHHLQRMLMHDLELSYADVEADDDGNYPLHTDSGVLIYARLIHAEDQVWVRLWAEAARGLRRTAKLLREVNEINQRHVGSRVLLTDHGSLVVAAEVRADSVEYGELGTLIGILTDTVTEIGGLVQIVYGEPLPASDDAARGAGTA
jgi:hypothetical protein